MDPCSQEVLIYDICFRVVFFTALIHTDCVELPEPGYCPLFSRGNLPREGFRGCDTNSAIRKWCLDS